MASYPYMYAQSYTYTPFFTVVLPILALILVVAGGLALYFLFVRKPNRFSGAAAKLHDILTFRTFFTEHIVRMLYCITVTALVVYSIILLFSHFFAALLLFVIGNLVARITFEYALLLLVLCRNAQEINRKMPPAAPAPQDAPAPQPQPPVPPAAPADSQPPVPPAAPAPQPEPPQQPPEPPVE